MNSKHMSLGSMAVALGLFSIAFFSTSCIKLSPKNPSSEIKMHDGQEDNGTFTSSVALLELLENKQWIERCTATKIARNILLTAAHCVLQNNGLIDGKYFQSPHIIGGFHVIATGKNEFTGPKQELRIKSIDFFPGLIERFQKCRRDCLKIVQVGGSPVPDLNIRFPDMAVITYADEIQTATAANLGIFDFNDHKKLALSGQGVNVSTLEWKKIKQLENQEFDSIMGDNRFIEFFPSQFNDLIAKLEASLVHEDTSEFTPHLNPIEENTTICIKQRCPISYSTWVNSKRLKGERMLEAMPPAITDGYAMLGDSGDGIFNRIGKDQMIVGVNSALHREIPNPPTNYFAIATAITKNPMLNTYKWISDLIEKNELKNPLQR